MLEVVLLGAKCLNNYIQLFVVSVLAEGRSGELSTLKGNGFLIAISRYVS
jgi:hypothetical protein